jgi:hypothetical protein
MNMADQKTKWPRLGGGAAGASRQGPWERGGNPRSLCLAGGNENLSFGGHRVTAIRKQTVNQLKNRPRRRRLTVDPLGDSTLINAKLFCEARLV